MKVIIIDLITENGHINFIRNYLDILIKIPGVEDIKFISSRNYVKKINYKNSDIINNWFFTYKNKYIYVLKQVLLLFYLVRVIKKKYKSYILLISGFENISFSLVSRFFKNKTFLVIHNNLTRNRLSIFFFRLISKKIEIVVLEDYIKNFIESEYKKKCYFIPHPINENYQIVNNPSNKNTIIFSPSASSNFNEVDILISQILNNNNIITFIAKYNKEFNSSKIVLKKYFEDYEELLKNSDFIFLPFKYDYRVSGIFYEAMSYNKVIISTPNSGRFIYEVKQKYPNSIFIIENISQLKSIQINKELKYKDYLNFISLHKSDNIALYFKNILKNIK